MGPKDLVADCLYISQSLKSVALTVLKEVKTRCEKSSETGSYIEPGSTVRYVGRYNSSLGKYRYDDTSDTEPVIFLSAPYLLLTEKIPRQRFNGNHYMRSLLEVLYGYDDGTSQKTANGAQNIFSNEEGKWRTLQVPQLWSLIVGAGKRHFKPFRPVPVQMLTSLKIWSLHVLSCLLKKSSKTTSLSIENCHRRVHTLSD